MSAQWTLTSSQSLTCEFSSPPTYWIGLVTRESNGSSRSNRDSTLTAAMLRGPLLAARRQIATWAAKTGSADGEQHADRQRLGEHRRSAVGHERQRQAGDRRQAEVHPDVLEGLEREPADDADRQQASGAVGVCRDPQAAPTQHGEQHDDQPGAEQPELLAGNAVHEVGLLLGHERAVG